MTSIPHTNTTYGHYFRRYLRVGLPILLTSLSPILLALTDNIMVGSLGETFRAATSFSNALTAPAFVLLIGVSSVLMPLVAGARVSSNYEKATRWLQYGVMVSFFCGLICVLLLAILERFLDHLGQDPHIIALMRGGYFQIITLSVFLASLSQPLKRYADGLGFSFLNTIVSFSTSFMNVLLNYILIYGKMGLPALGMNGAALATFCCRLISLSSYLVMVGFFRRRGYISGFSLRKFQAKYFRKMLKLGLPAGFEFAMKLLYLSVIRGFIGRIGVEAQAASAIIFDVMRLGVMWPVAMGTAGSILLAEAFRRGTREVIWRVRRIAYFLNICFVAALAVVLYFFFPWILDHFFHPQKEVATLVLPLVSVILLYQGLDGLTFVGAGLLRGIRDTFVPFLVTTFFSFGVGLPLSYYFSRRGGLGGILYGMMIGLFFATVVLYGRFTYRANALLAWQEEKKRA